MNYKVTFAEEGIAKIVSSRAKRKCEERDIDPSRLIVTPDRTLIVPEEVWPDVRRDISKAEADCYAREARDPIFVYNFK